MWEGVCELGCISSVQQRSVALLAPNLRSPLANPSSWHFCWGAGLASLAWVQRGCSMGVVVPACLPACVQECMIGYSDSGKDAGRLAAAWGLYEVQERLTKVGWVGVGRARR